jgi:hypothetical protein
MSIARAGDAEARINFTYYLVVKLLDQLLGKLRRCILDGLDHKLDSVFGETSDFAAKADITATTAANSSALTAPETIFTLG